MFYAKVPKLPCRSGYLRSLRSARTTRGFKPAILVSYRCDAIAVEFIRVRRAAISTNLKLLPT